MFRILPGTKPLYYTSFLFKQSFTISQTGPRTLNREEIRMRNQNQREFCIQLEQFNHSENVFVDNYHKIEKFLEDERDAVKIIQISGNQGSGRQTLVELAIEKLFQNCTVVQIDFDCIKNFEDFYIHLLKQFNWEITRQTEKDLRVLSDEHKTFKKPWETQLDHQIAQNIFPVQMMDMRTPQYNRLYNILNNAVYDYWKSGTRLVMGFYNVNRYVSDLIPLWPCTIFITTSQLLYLRNGPKTEILSLKSKPLTLEQLRQYMGLHGYSYSDDIYECLLKYTCNSLPRILRVAEKYRDELPAFMEKFSTWSYRKQKAFFDDQESYVINPELIKPIACLATFPDVFTREMMENLLRPLIEKRMFIVRELENDSTPTDEKLQLLINMIQPYLYKMRGKYFISPGIRSYVLR